MEIVCPTNKFLFGARGVVVSLAPAPSRHHRGLHQKRKMACKNCHRFAATPYLHSFSAALDQCKNQSWQPGSGWIVTPTTAQGTEAISGATFCSGDCLYSYIFSHELLSNKEHDAVLHFFKRVDVLKSSDSTLGVHGPRMLNSPMRVSRLVTTASNVKQATNAFSSCLSDESERD